MTDMTSSVRQSARSAWWVPLTQGVVALLLGLLLFGQPGMTLVVLSLWLGIYWLVDGVLYLVSAATGRGGARGWLIFTGVISVVAGLFVLAQPLLAGAITTTVAVYLLALAIIANGFIQLFAGQETGVQERERSWVGVLLGILYVIAGFFLLFHPFITAVTLLSFVSIWAIAVGITYIVLAFRLRSL